MSNERVWLEHLKDSIPDEGKGYSVSMYTVALEGWRRGLKLKFINKNRRRSEIFYSLTYNGKEHVFTVSKGDKVSDKAIEICRNKHLAKQYLKKAGVPTPEGELFNKDASEEEIVDYAKKLGFPNVIKPVDGTGGSGVIANIQNEAEFKKALSFVRNDLGKKNIIVEKHFDGRGYRVYVVDNQVIAAFDRIPANVVGDGKKNIKTLLDEKIKIRNENPALFKRPIKIDKEMYALLEAQGYTLESVPKKGERVFLKTKNNVSSGGDSIDVTDKLTDEIKDIAVRAVQAIPELEQCGLDLIADEENNTAVILELNSMPSIRNHLFPNEGKARDIPKAIIDFYFPETKNINYKDRPLYYFDLKVVFDSFKNGQVKEITIPDYPQGELEATRFVVSGLVHHVGYGKWIRKKARKLSLNGYIKHLSDGTTSIVVSGPKDSVDKFREIIHHEAPKNAKITRIEEKERKSPVKIGFEIINSSLDKKLKDGYHPVRIKDIKSNIKNKKVKKKKTTIDYEKEYKKLINSTSWKVTKPLRYIGRLLKQKRN